MFFSLVSQSLKKNADLEVSYDDLIHGCLDSGESLYGCYPLTDMTHEDFVLSRYILRMSFRKKCRHKLINYVIDALNLHSALQENLNAYFITRNEETLNLFKSLKTENFNVKDKEDFLIQFLISKNK